jgi:hypothetical protein
MTGQCPTCRIEVEHIIKLELAIKALRPKARAHRGGHRIEYFRNIEARRKAKERRTENRCEHRDAIRTLAVHLTEHAERRAA